MLFEKASEFSYYIEQSASEHKMPLIDAILLYCDDHQLEPQDLTPLISKSLRDKLEMEFIELNYLKGHLILDL